MKGWLDKTRVRNTFDGRVGTVIGDPVVAGYYPEVAWDDGTYSEWIDGDLLERSPDDWLNRANENQEKI